MTTTGPTTIEELDSPSDVLAFARSNRRAADAAEAAVLLAAVTWAEQHPPESIDEAATWLSGAGDTGLPLAGPGAATGGGVLHRGVRARGRALD